MMNQSLCPIELPEPVNEFDHRSMHITCGFVKDKFLPNNPFVEKENKGYSESFFIPSDTYLFPVLMHYVMCKPA